MNRLFILGLLLSLVACSSEEDPRRQIIRDIATTASNPLSGDELECWTDTLLDASSEQIDNVIAQYQLVEAAGYPNGRYIEADNPPDSSSALSLLFSVIAECGITNF